MFDYAKPYFKVLEDRSNKLKTGTVLDSIEAAKSKATLVLLPFSPKANLYNPIGGFAKLDCDQFQMFSRLNSTTCGKTLIYFNTETRNINWRCKIKLLTKPERETYKPPTGFIQIVPVGDTLSASPCSQLQGPGSIFDLSKLEFPDSDDSWVIGDSIQHRINSDGYYVFGFRAAVEDIKLVWTAFSQS